MIRSFIEYYLLSGRRQFKREQQRLWSMRNTHDIGMLPGGYLIHYSICECKEQDND